MRISVVGYAVQALAKCPVYYLLSNEQAVLPTPPGGPGFSIDIGLAINVRCTGNLFD